MTTTFRGPFDEPADNPRKNDTELKLFVWTDFAPDYTGGLAFAIAKTEEDARKMVIGQYGINPSDWGDLHTLPLTRKVSFAVGGGS